MKMIESKQGDVLAIIWSHDMKVDGAKFLVPDSYPLQVGLIEHKENKKVEAHKHVDYLHDMRNTQEFIYVEKGEVEAKIYDTDIHNKFELVEEVKLGRGDFMLQVSGGHEFLIKKGSRLIEIKQGPYHADNAKIYKD